MPDAAFFWFLGFAALGTSIVSGIVGMAGGMLLLGAMLLRLEPVVAIPLHGIVQFVSNASRAWLQRRHVDFGAVWRFALPVFPAAFLGVALARTLPERAALVAVALFVLGAVWAPRLFSFITRPRGDARRGLYWGGALIGFFSPIVGATGPFLAPFVLALELSPQGMIGTLAACQIFQHASKVAVFGLTGFDFAKYLVPSAALCAAAVLGSAIGTRLVDRVDERTFKKGVRLVLTALAMKLAFDGILG